jgi:hypothetical protein
MPEIGSSGLMSGDGKRGVGHRPQATAPILDSTNSEVTDPQKYFISTGPGAPLAEADIAKATLLNIVGTIAEKGGGFQIAEGYLGRHHDGAWSPDADCFGRSRTFYSPIITSH